MSEKTKTIGKETADILTRELGWPWDSDWRNLLSGHIPIDRADPEAAILTIVGMAGQLCLEKRLFMVEKRAEAKKSGDLILVEAIGAAREYLSDLKWAIQQPGFEEAVRAWVIGYIASLE